MILLLLLYGLEVRLVHRKIDSCQRFTKVSLHNIVCMYQTIIILIVLVICTQRVLCVKPVHHTIIRAAFVCLFVPLPLRGPLTDLPQTWWVYVGGPWNCP